MSFHILRDILLLENVWYSFNYIFIGQNQGNNNLFGNNNTTPSTASSGLLFGNTSSAGKPGGLFGNTNTGNTGGLFGNSNTNTTGGGLFGNTNTNPAPATGGGLFGNAAAPAPATGGLLGNANTTPAAPAVGGLFANAAAPAPSTTGGGLFGNTNTTGNTTTTGGLFGNAAGGTGSLFGNAAGGAGGAGSGIGGGGPSLSQVLNPSGSTMNINNDTLYKDLQRNIQETIDKVQGYVNEADSVLDSLQLYKGDEVKEIENNINQVSLSLLSLENILEKQKQDISSVRSKILKDKQVALTASPDSYFDAMTVKNRPSPGPYFWELLENFEKSISFYKRRVEAVERTFELSTKTSSQKPAGDLVQNILISEAQIFMNLASEVAIIHNETEKLKEQYKIKDDNKKSDLMNF